MTFSFSLSLKVMKISLSLSLLLLVICQGNATPLPKNSMLYLGKNYEDLVKRYQEELAVEKALSETFDQLKRNPFVPPQHQEPDQKNLKKIENVLHDVFQALKEYPISSKYPGGFPNLGKDKLAKLVPEILVTRLM